MELSWLETAGRTSVVLFGVLVAGLLVMLAARCWSPRRHVVHSGRVTRFVVEYVGNLSLDDGLAFTAAAGGLVQQVQREMERRRVPLSAREQFLSALCETLHAEGRDLAEADRRYLETRRWGLAEHFSDLVGDPPPDVLARIKNGLAELE